MDVDLHFQRIEALNWQGRIETEASQRIYQKITILNESVSQVEALNHALCILGFCTDIGVIRNQGRPGAKDAPNAIRKILGNMPYHPLQLDSTIQICDLGNIICPDDDLEKAQRRVAEEIRTIRQKNGFSFVLGGGHEIAWAHYQGLQDLSYDEDFAIVNFDAHFDMRPQINAKANSGTAFLQIARERQQQNLPFHYYCIGIRQQANTASLYETADVWNVNYLHCDDIYEHPKRLELFIDAILAKHRKIYLTVCMDVFSASVAPGVSASFPHGLMPWHVLPALDKLAHSQQVIAFDIAEYAPNLDHDHITAKLAALIAANFINIYSR
ncbi:MAG: formimidoylglutamase [Candidatus Berkiella sp.]